MSSAVVWTLAIIAAHLAIVLIALTEAVKAVGRLGVWMVATQIRFVSAACRQTKKRLTKKV